MYHVPESQFANTPTPDGRKLAAIKKRKRFKVVQIPAEKGRKYRSRKQRQPLADRAPCMGDGIMSSWDGERAVWLRPESKSSRKPTFKDAVAAAERAS